MLELGRYRRPKMPRFERICTTCSDEVEDEIHFILRCPALVNARRPRAPPLDKCFKLYEDFQTCIKHNHAPSEKKMVIGMQLVTAFQVQFIGCIQVAGPYVCGCNYTREHGIRSKFTCRVMLNAYSGCLWGCIIVATQRWEQRQPTLGRKLMCLCYLTVTVVGSAPKGS